MKAKYLRNLILLVLLMSGMVSCSEETAPFVLRNTDILEFAFETSSQTFTLRSNGPWSVSSENDWITLDPTSGTSDGIVYETITVTVLRNEGEDRTGKISINAAGMEIYINVLQSVGPIITFGDPILFGALQETEDASSVRIRVPYSGAIGDEKFTVSITASGEGASGIKPVTNYEVQLNGKSGFFDVPLSGSPTASGNVTFNITTSYTSLHSYVTIPECKGLVYPPLDITLGTPVLSNAETFYVTRKLDNVVLEIPYTEGEIGLSFTLSVDISGITGINSIENVPINVTSSTGTIKIPVKGIPYHAGEALFKIVYPGPELPTITVPVIDNGKRYFPGGILVTGAMPDPRGNDCNTSMNVSWYNPNEDANVHGDGYEYVQLMATEDIDFSVTPYSVIIAKNTANQKPTSKGWIEGGSRTYKFNLTEGTVSRGEFFYIGGMAKALNGYSSNANGTTTSSFDGSVVNKVWTGNPIKIPEWAPQNGGTTQTTGGIISMREAKWIRTKAYIREGGDDGIGNPTTGNNSNLLSNTPNPQSSQANVGVDGIAVFEGTAVTEESVPIDLIFFGTNATNAFDYTTNSMGYTVPLNEFYSPVNLSSGEAQPYLGQGSNSSFLKGGQPELTMGLPCSAASGISNGRDCSAFVKFAGELDSDNSWIKPRETRTIYLLEPKFWLEHYQLSRPAQLSDIESNVPEAGDNGMVMIIH